MKVLFVDDELPAIEGTVSAVNWGQLGILEVLTACSCEEAEKIIETNHVDILICDIEMPRGSGIDLLRWVRKIYPEMEAIFLTAHADFKYAQQAVQLGCVDYVLKPVESEELEQILNKAISQINQRNETLQYRQYGKFWLQNKPLVFERFWLDVMNGTIPPDKEAIHLASIARSIHRRNDGFVLPIMIKVQRWYKTIDLKEENKYQTALCDLTEEVLRTVFVETSIFPVEHGIFVSVSEIPNGSMDMTSLKIKLESLIVQCNQSFFCDVSIYVGEPVLIVDLSSIMDRLKAIDLNNVNIFNKVFLPERQVPGSIKINLPDFNFWSKLMAEGLRESLHEEVIRYQQFLKAQSGTDARFLLQFHQDFLQMVYVVLQAKGIQAHQLFNDKQTQELSIKAARMIPDLFYWVNFVIEKTCDYMVAVELKDSIMDKVRRYVAQHINNEELTCEEIANFVFLNPDYLTRIVKRETGLPLNEYIQNQRIALAKELLIKTNLPVSEIATRVGYMHFSQFSKIFKKHVDMTPIQFRHMQKQGNE